MFPYLMILCNAIFLYFALFAALIAVSNLGFFGYMGVFLMYAAYLVLRCYYTKVGFKIPGFQKLVSINVVVFLGVAELFTRYVIVRENWLRTGDYLDAFILGFQTFLLIIPTYIIISLILRSAEYFYNVWLRGDKSNFWGTYRKWEAVGFLVMITWLSFTTVAKVFVLSLA